MRQVVCWGMLLGVLLLNGCAEHGVERLTTVNDVKLSRYMGQWFQVALIPNRFQEQCVAQTSATYRLRDDGKVDVFNRCRTADEQWDEAQGLARVVDQQTHAKLEVSFFSFWGWRPIWGDYWILGLKDDYSLALVGDPERKYGWVLARQPSLSAADKHLVEEWIKAAGYELTRFRWDETSR